MAMVMTFFGILHITELDRVPRLQMYERNGSVPHLSVAKESEISLHY